MKFIVTAVSAFLLAVQFVAARPNILFVMSDDHTSQAISAYGSRLSAVVKTPVIDSLAAEGILMRNAYCTNSICTPSRASIFSGKYSHENGVKTLNNSYNYAKHPHFSRILGENGYSTGLVGKYHMRSQPEGFDWYKVLDGQGEYVNPRFRVTGKAWSNTGEVADTGHSSDRIADAALEFLKVKRDKSKPWVLCLHFKAPHDKFQYADRYEGLYEDVHFPEPSTLWQKKTERPTGEPKLGNDMIDLLDTRLYPYTTSASRKRVKDSLAKAHPGVSKDSLNRIITAWVYQEYLQSYFRCVKGIEDNLSRVLAYIRDTMNVLDSTVIMYTGDQGFLLGEHNLYDKRWMLEESFRMPFIVRYPPTIKPGIESTALVNNTDYAPTILDLAGVPVPEDMQGRSFKSILETRVVPRDWRTGTYYRYWMGTASHEVPKQYGLRTSRFKVIYYYDKDLPSAGIWELYDMVNDPKETKNLVDDPLYADTLLNMQLDLADLQEELGDEPASSQKKITAPAGFERWVLEPPVDVAVRGRFAPAIARPSGPVEYRIVDARGRVVRRVVETHESWKWDKCNQAGFTVAPGIYFVTAPGRRGVIRKITVAP